MDTIGKAKCDVFSTLNNLETLLKEGKVKDTTTGYRHLRLAKQIHEFLEEKESSWNEIETFTDTASHEAWLSERRKLNIIDIDTNASPLIRHRSNLLNTLRRIEITAEIRKPLEDYGIVPHGGYANTLQVLVLGTLVWEVSIVYPPGPTTVELTTSDNRHNPSDRVHQLHQDLDNYTKVLLDNINLVGMLRDDGCSALDNMVDEIVHTIRTA